MPKLNYTVLVSFNCLTFNLCIAQLSRMNQHREPIKLI